MSQRLGSDRWPANPHGKSLASPAILRTPFGGRSSVGRALPLQGRCQGFDSPRLHQRNTSSELLRPRPGGASLVPRCTPGAQNSRYTATSDGLGRTRRTRRDSVTDRPCGVVDYAEQRSVERRKRNDPHRSPMSTFHLRFCGRRGDANLLTGKPPHHLAPRRTRLHLVLRRADGIGNHQRRREAALSRSRGAEDYRPTASATGGNTGCWPPRLCHRHRFACCVM